VNRRSLALCAALPLLVPVVGTTSPATAAAAASALYTVVPLSFSTTVGPDDDQKCTVVGDLYLPKGKTTGAALLTTNGFGGSKNDGGTQGNASFAKQYASRGYVALSYSGLGFGGSGCLIELDDPAWDGKAGDQLAQFLGGRKGIATRTDTKAPYDLPAGLVRTQGDANRYDPVLGMIGGSYGGEIQFATAKYGRVDALVPQITWNDLSYSLAPNNTSQQRTATRPRSVTYATPGTEKVGWTTLFFAIGFGQPVLNQDLSTLIAQVAMMQSACPNFDMRACTAKADLDADGAPNADTLAFARHASVATYLDDIKAPVLLSQGQSDTLFNLQESIATYSALKARGVDVKMVWQKWGHSDSKPAPGELDAQRAPDASYLGKMYAQWFDHYLLGTAPAPALDIEYFRDYVPYKGATAADAAKAYAQSPGYPVAPTSRFYLSGTDALTADAGAVKDGQSSFASVVPAGAPSSYSEIPVLAQDKPVFDAPGTFAKFTTKPLSKSIDIVGVPAVTVKLSSATFAASSSFGAPGQLVLFVKLYDTAPNGTVVLQHRLVAPARIASFDKPVRIELPGVVQKVPAGHTLSLVLAASDSGHRGNTLAGDVTVQTTKAAPGVLELPILPAAPEGRAMPSASATTPSGTGRTNQDQAVRASRNLATTGLPPALPVVALVLVGGSVALVRRRSAASAP